ncbi:MAG: ketoacyl-ACP synthase III [Bacteroidales bacterium]|nr:ketoacyl-ACP synthase III [Bacteroidales bacterium]
MNAKITAMGGYAPERVVTNDDMAKLVDTSDEWITKRTGIKERRYVSEDQTLCDLCEEAVKDLIKRSNVEIEDVDFIIVATSTSEHIIPSVASQIQYRFGIKKTGAIDVIAACSGFVYGINLAKSMVVTGAHKKVLVIGADVLTKATNFEDRTTCILFGDGAGAAIVEPSDEVGIMDSVTGTDGEGGSALYLTAGLKTLNGDPITINNMIYQDGRKVFKWAVATVSKQFEELLKKNNMTVDDIDYFVPHSANKRIMEAICENVGFPYEKTLVSVDYFGNTSAASIPLAIWQGMNKGVDLKGKTIMLIGFGGGLTYAGTIVKGTF